MTAQISMPPFWPSRRLWLKFFIGFIYVPLLFVLLMWVFFTGLFSSSSEQVLYAIPFVLILIGGPISVGLLLAPGWRGAGAGLVSIVAIPAIWHFAGVAKEAAGFIDNDLQLGIVAAIIVILLELITRDVRGQAEFLGLGAGLAVGLFLVFVNKSLVGPFYNTGNNGLMFFSLYPPNALIWLSTLFFPEGASRKVGWGGVIVWIALVTAVFGLSFAVMK